MKIFSHKPSYLLVIFLFAIIHCTQSQVLDLERGDNGLYGYKGYDKDYHRVWVIEPQYQEAKSFNFNTVRIAAVKKNNFWGLIDPQGNQVIAFDFDELIPYIKIWYFKKGDKCGVIEENFEIKYSFSADEIKICSEENGIAITVKKGKYGVVNLKDEIIVPHKYEYVSLCYQLIVAQTNNKLIVYGKSGHKLYDIEQKIYDEGANLGLRTVTRIDSLVWVFNSPSKKKTDFPALWVNVFTEQLYFLNSEFMMQAKYSKEMKNIFKAGSNLVCVGYNNYGKLIYQYFDLAQGKSIGPVFDGVGEIREVHWRSKYYKTQKISLIDVVTLIPAAVKGATNVINSLTAETYTNTEEKTDWVFGGGMFVDNIALVSKDGFYGYMNTTGELIVPPRYFAANSYSGGMAGVISDTSSSLWGFINTSGEEVITAKYKFIGSFSSGYCPVTLKEEVYFIDNKGELAFDKDPFEQALSFSEGLAAVKRNGKWGYIDNSGKWVIDAKFDQASAFIDGLAIIRTEDSIWATINPQGELKIIDPPK